MTVEQGLDGTERLRSTIDRLLVLTDEKFDEALNLYDPWIRAWALSQLSQQVRTRYAEVTLRRFVDRVSRS